MTDEIREKLMDEVDARKDKVINLLQQLVRIPSVTGEEGEIQRFIADYLKNLGLEVDVWDSDRVRERSTSPPLSASSASPCPRPAPPAP